MIPYAVSAFETIRAVNEADCDCSYFSHNDYNSIKSSSGSKKGGKNDHALACILILAAMR